MIKQLKTYIKKVIKEDKKTLQIKKLIKKRQNNITIIKIEEISK